MKTPFAADCHFHIIDHARFPFPGNLGYTPHRGESGTFKEISDSFRMQGITHGVAKIVVNHLKMIDIHHQ